MCCWRSTACFSPWYLQRSQQSPSPPNSEQENLMVYPCFVDVQQHLSRNDLFPLVVGLAPHRRPTRLIHWTLTVVARFLNMYFKHK